MPWPGPATASAEPSVARVQAVSVAVATLAHVRGLPRLPKLGPAPGEAGAVGGHRPRPDAAVLHKVTSLLAKAESTTFPDEAEALTAKAQELMTRHAIDRAQLEAGRGADPVAGGRRVAVDDPYANARYLLLSAVADANRCRAVWTRQWGFSTVFGDEGDLDAVELLFTSLLVQATRAMVLEPVSATGNGGRTRSFRHAFLVAFAGRIGERLARASEAATADAARHSTAVVPLFEARRAAADRALGEAFPETRTMRVSARNAEGWQAGVRAADRAQLGHERPVRGRARPACGDERRPVRLADGVARPLDGRGHRGRGRRARGCLVGFHSQSSIDPARYCVWLSKANHTYRVTLLAAHVGIHLLTDGDRELAELFGTVSGDDVDKFALVEAEVGAEGVPVLAACPHRLVARRRRCSTRAATTSASSPSRSRPRPPGRSRRYACRRSPTSTPATTPPTARPHPPSAPPPLIRPLGLAGGRGHRFRLRGGRGHGFQIRNRCLDLATGQPDPVPRPSRRQPSPVAMRLAQG